MADNYLEKKYEEWKNGKPAVRRTNPSLETLLKRLGDIAEPDFSYTVKQVQLDAIVRAAGLLGGELEYRCDESQSSITISGKDSFAMAQAILVMRLKAAELRLRAEIIDNTDTTDITLKISRSL